MRKEREIFLGEGGYLSSVARCAALDSLTQTSRPPFYSLMRENWKEKSGPEIFVLDMDTFRRGLLGRTMVFLAVRLALSLASN